MPVFVPRTPRAIRSVAAWALALLIVACGGGGGGSSPNPPAPTPTTATLTALSVTPTSASFAKGGTRQFIAMGAYSDGTSKDETNTVTWTSSAPTIATVGTTGIATGMAAGSATLTATSGTKTAQATVTISAATLQSLAITPANPSVVKGSTKAFAATGTYSDGSVSAVAATWTSSATAVATINASGVATGVAAGSTTITATYGTVSATTTLVVSAATLTSIQVLPANPTVVKSLTQAFTAQGTYSDGSTAALSSGLIWASATTSVATINASGVATGVDYGTSQISASLGGITGSTTLTVGAAPAGTITSIAVTPALPTITQGATVQLTATASISTGGTQNITSTATWTSGSNAVATVTSAGLVTGVAPGSAVIQARAPIGTVTGQTTVTVTAGTPTLVSITVSPATATLSIGGTVDLGAVGNFSNNTSTSPYDSQVTWTSTAPSVATVNAGGLVTAVGAGSATIRATSGSIVGSAAITVSGPTFDPALVGRWEWIGVPNPVDFSNYGSFYNFYSDGTFTYTLIYDSGNACITTSRVVAYHAGTFSSATGQIILNCTTLYDDYTNCSGSTTRFTKSPAVQIHQASFQGGLLYTNNTNDFANTGWLGHVKK